MNFKHILENIKNFNNKTFVFFKFFDFKNKKIKQIVATILFFILIHFFYSYIGIYKYINFRPCSIHSSAQCQRASVALNYYKTDMNFFTPRVQKFTKGTGITGLEFPIIYYSAAVLYKIFGFNEVYLKAISLSLVTLGFFLFYLLALQYLKNILLSISIVTSAFTSPVLLYYTPNIMPDAPSIGLVIAAWFFFFQYLKTDKNKYLNLFIFFGTIAALIKVISIICFIIIIFLLALDWLKFFKNENNIYLFKKKLKIFKRIILGFIFILSWYLYANWLTKAYNNPTFSLSPETLSDLDTFYKVIDNIKSYWLFQYYSSETYTLIFGCLLFIIITYKTVNKLLLIITILYLLGSLCYVFLFFNQFMHHDYYIIALIPFVLFFLLTFADSLYKCSLKYSIFMLLIFDVIIFLNLKECVIKCENNYSFRYLNRVYLDGIDYKPYGDLEPRLRALGVKRTDMTISGFDDSFCSSLYLMDQCGVNIGSWSDKNNINEFILNHNFKYLILNDSAKFNKIYKNNLKKNIILTHRGLIVYKLNN